MYLRFIQLNSISEQLVLHSCRATLPLYLESDADVLNSIYTGCP